MKRLAFAILGLVVAFGSIRFYHIYQYSSPTPKIPDVSGNVLK